MKNLSLMSDVVQTNEEKRVPKYFASGRPTIAGEVTPETSIDSMNLNWREKELPEKERTKHVHRLHPYLGKFIPQLIEIFLRKYFKPGQTVLDPFCGSGTTLVQANELGINSIGYDISAFNVLLCKTKTAKYDLEKLEKEVLDILEKARAATQVKSDQQDLWKAGLTKPKLSEIDNEYLHKWFAPQALRELIAYRSLIDTEGYEYKDLLKIILCRSARSARLTTHFDLDFPKQPQTNPYQCYKHSRVCRPTQEAFKFIRRYSIDTIKRIKEFAALRADATVTVRHADSRNVAIPPIDGIITSPPYVGLIDYHEQHAYAYHLLGLQDKRAKEIGPAAQGSGQEARRKYQINIAKVLQNAMDSMREKGPIIIIANDKSNLYDEIAKLVGVDVEGIVQRHVNRRTGRRSGAFYESVFIWRNR